MPESSSNKKQRIFFWHGENSFAIHEQKLAWQKAFKEKYGDINIVKLAFDEASGGYDNLLAELKNALQADSLFGLNKFIIIKNLLQNKTPKSALDSAKEILDSSIKNLSEKYYIVFIQTENFKKTISLYKTLQKWQKQQLAQIQEFSLPKSYELNKWIQARARKTGLRIDQDALQQLNLLIGSDLWQLSNELEKLSNYCGGKPVGREEINLLVKGKFNENIFDLVDAFGNRNKKQASSLITGQLNNGINHLYILTMLQRQFRILLQIKDLQSNENFIDKQTVAGKLRLHPFVAAKSLEQSNNFSMEQLKKIFSRLCDLEISFKTSSPNPGLHFNLLITEFAA